MRGPLPSQSYKLYTPSKKMLENFKEIALFILRQHSIMQLAKSDEIQ